MRCQQFKKLMCASVLRAVGRFVRELLAFELIWLLWSDSPEMNPKSLANLDILLSTKLIQRPLSTIWHYSHEEKQQNG